jgi:hypothetical protein
LKDNNLLNNGLDRVIVQDRLKRDLVRRIEKDTEFLKSCFLMDYSLLIYFLKKSEFNDDESCMTYRNMKRSIVIKKGVDG